MGDGPVRAGLLQAGDQLAELELLPGAVPLDDQEGCLLDPLEGGEASTTDRAGAPTADRPPVLGRTGVDHAVLVGPAKRATHSVSSPGRPVPTTTTYSGTMPLRRQVFHNILCARVLDPSLGT